MADKKISALTAAITPLDGTEVLPIVQSGSTVKVANNDLRPKQIQSNATSGVLQVTGPAAASTRVMTVPNANFTAARTDAAQTFSGTQTIKNTVTLDRYGDATEGLTLSTNTGNGVYNTFGGENHVWQAAGAEKARLSTSGGYNLGTDSNDPGAGNLRLANGNLVQGTAAKGINFTANTAAAGMTSQLLNWYEEGTWTPSVGGNATYTRQQGYYTRIGRQVTIQCDMIINVLGTGSTQYITNAPFSSGGVFYAGSVSYWSSLTANYYYVTPMLYNTQIQFNTIISAGSAINDSSTIFGNGARVILTVTYFV